MRNNLAELLDICIDPIGLQVQWRNQIEYSQGFKWQERNYVKLDFFTQYFQVLLDTVSDIVNE